MKSNLLFDTFKNKQNSIKVFLSLCPALLFFLFAFMACGENSEFDEVENEEAINPKYYLTIQVTTSTQKDTRGDSFTTGDGASNLGNVEATELENSINSAHLYFCRQNTILVELEADYVSEPEGSNLTLRLELTDKLNQLLPLVQETPQIIELYIVGNLQPDVDVDDDLSDVTFEISSADDSLIGDFGSNGKTLPLSNANKYEILIPAIPDGKTALETIQSLFTRKSASILWWDVKDKNNKTDIDLERSVARLEFKDIDRTGFPSYPLLTTEDSEEDIVSPDDETDENESQEETPEVNSREVGTLIPYSYFIGNLNVVIQLDQMQVFNVNNESFLFRHTATGDKSGWEEDSKILFGEENGGVTSKYNWISSPWWYLDPRVPSFSNPLIITETEYKINGTAGRNSVADITSRNNGSNPADGYHPWCYVTENTLYNTAIMEYLDEDDDYLLTKYATGVMFYFKVLDAKGNPITSTTPIEDYPKEVSKSTYNIGNIEITNPADGSWVGCELTSDKEGNECYYLRYIACIVHNDATMDDDAIAPMFYGTVRNNTYQMRVAKIPGLPLPQDPRTIHLQIDCQVRDWNVRWDENATLY